MQIPLNIAIPEHLDIISEEFSQELHAIATFTEYKDFPQGDDELVRRIGDAQFVIVKWQLLNDAVLEKLPHLKYIITLSVGYDHIPVKKATELGIKVINCPVHNTYAVVEHTFALLFAHFRKVQESEGADPL